MKNLRYTSLILAVWLVVVALATLLTFVTSTTQVADQIDLMEQSATLTKQCQDAIKARKQQLGISISETDKFATGMIGIPSWEYFDGSYGDYIDEYKGLLAITTTEGDLQAKLTSCDPNWAALMISLYQRANLKPGDQVGMVFSGSFPAMNLAVLASAQVYGLDICVMSGIGASYFGANDPRFTFFEMVNYLCDIGLLTHRIDYVSLGGEDDVLKNVNSLKAEAKPYIDRIQDVIANSTSTYIYQPDYSTNVSQRIQYLDSQLPQMKFFINVGGTMVGLGKAFSAFTKVGYVSANKKYSTGERNDNVGLLQYYNEQGLPVANFLNFHQLSLWYNVPYVDETCTVAPQIGLTDYNVQRGYYSFYYDKSYSPVYAIVALSISAVLSVLYLLCRKKYQTEPNHNTRNQLLNRK